MKITLHMMKILCVFCAVLPWGLSAGSAASRVAPSQGDASRQNLVVVELFTSQGCSSCPPADDVLAEFSRQGDILALSYSVDFWDYLGWKDTFAQPDCVIRQRKYNIALGKSGIYTPQMIIQGARDLIGSRRQVARQMVARMRADMAARKQAAPDINFASSGKMINLRIGALMTGGGPVATIWVIGYDHEKTVAIASGELKGQVRKYHNVVQAIKRIGSWMGKDTRLTLSPQDIGDRDYDGYALLLQTRETGPIIAAAKLTMN